MFSQLRFDLEILNLLFKAKVSQTENSHYQNPIYRKVKVSNWQFLKLWWKLNNPYVLIATALGLGVVMQTGDEAEGGEIELENLKNDSESKINGRASNKVIPLAEESLGMPQLKKSTIV